MNGVVTIHADEPSSRSGLANSLRLVLAIGAVAGSLSAIALAQGTAAPSRITIARGVVSPAVVRNVPEWALENIASCYEDSLREDPDQEGEVLFSLTPPEGDGPVTATVGPRGALSDGLVRCVREALESVCSYPSVGNAQPRVRARLSFRRTLQSVPAFPTPEAVRGALAADHARDPVVDVASARMDAVHHVRTSDGRLLRMVDYAAWFEFVDVGFETRCVHYGPYTVLGRAPLDPRPAGHTCEDVPHRPGDRVEVRSSMGFVLTDRGWETGEPAIAYCGDGPCP